tara:strand:- start:1421 stop:1924 length:504 start_codon:yes stop_codon:yes gene_type:complete
MEIFLRELDVNNISKEYVSWLNSDDVNKYTEQRYFRHTLSNVRSFVISKKKSKNEFLFGIFVGNEKKHVGNIKIGPINNIHKTAFISYFIGSKKFRSKGIMSKAFKKIFKLAKIKFKLKKIQAGIYQQNISSKNLLEKNNFKLEGVFVSQLVYKKKRYNKLIYGRVL